ncbi:GNAT family N-acetyltransferase [Qipengyuania spongiae]|uniref:GNAT family N-acetyltransferase n=1 Tax=Qipengyuania spongiae TaxID=2909673 RepID=A0ABY5SW76_9SPHN|nr:GNAT family N-acetyltransferase [Qipengyuania spongiae]UVI38803.1 GNAT family N-acetyltransferase [Qipengyuania spongiae]
MSGETNPCIVYLRQRESDRRGNTLALDQQTVIEAEAIRKEGWTLVGGFGDSEFADPFYGWLEPREGWQLALKEAECVARKYRHCTVLILRSDGIGEGDLFLPKWKAADADGPVQIRVASFSLRGHAISTSLRSANIRFERYCELERARDVGSAIDLGHTATSGKIVLRRDLRKHCIRLYYANHLDEPLELQWQAAEKPLHSDQPWSESSGWQDLTVPPKSGLWLQTFFQGERDPAACRWRFRVGKDRQRKVGNVIFSPMDFAGQSLLLRWSSYEPEPLSDYDLKWEERPAIETNRLVFKPWEAVDHIAFERHCNTPEVMRFLGGVQSPMEFMRDIELFRSAGKKGPTYWALQRRVDGELLGFCGLLLVEEAGSPVEGEWEIGWRIRQDAWRNGYAYEAAAAVLKSAFDEWEVEKVVCRIDRRNHASLRVAEKLGMTENTHLRHKSGEEDQELLVYEMGWHRFWATGMTSAALD